MACPTPRQGREGNPTNMKAAALTAAMLLMVMPAHAIDVAITSPGDGETVSGTIVVTGTSQDVGAGLVNVRHVLTHSEYDEGAWKE